MSVPINGGGGPEFLAEPYLRDGRCLHMNQPDTPKPDIDPRREPEIVPQPEPAPPMPVHLPTPQPAEFPDDPAPVEDPQPQIQPELPPEPGNDPNP